MTSRADRFGVIRLSASQLQHPALLNGLEAWLQLGLLSQHQVQQFCHNYLTCAVEPIPSDVSPALAMPPHEAERTNPGAALSRAAVSTADFADAVSEPNERPAPAPSANPLGLPTHWIRRTLQSVMAEIGVIWLLGLGVFLVVVSSGVLAASQWRNFSPVGQYSILLAYTLAFWGVGWWTGRQPALQLTTRMLQTATLLIIPVNFWMMDGLHLWQTGAGIGLNGLAALLLTVILVTLTPQLAAAPDRLTILNSLGLSWLHWGWSVAGIPLMAVYVGTISTALLTYLRLRQRPASDAPARFSLPTLIIALATLLLLGRAILAAQVPVAQLGLAFGLCGWLFCWLTGRRVQEPFAALWTTLGAGLLLLGWAVTVAATPPVQATLISGLGLWLLHDRLRRQDAEGPLLALLLLGLQTYILLWRILPLDWRQTLIEIAMQQLGTHGMPLALLGLAGFPYLWLMLSFANRLQRQQAKLAQRTELVALSFGVLLTALSALNPIVRSLTLTLSAVTLIATLHRRCLTGGWVYFNHGLILVALFSWIDACWPMLDELEWAKMGLGIMAIEWSLSVGEARLWRRSCWHFGLGLASLSYGVLWVGSLPTPAPNQANLIWLIAPALLTGLSRLRQFYSPQRAAWLSAMGLLAQLFLLDSVEGWLFSLAVATGLMGLNTWTVQHAAAALLTVGFGLGLEATILYRYFPDLLTFDRGMLVLAGTLWLLWLSEAWLRRRGLISGLYAASAHGWAIAIGLFGLLSLSLHHVAVYTFGAWLGEAASLNLVISSGLIVLAIAYRLGRRTAAGLDFDGGFYALAWATEVFVITLIRSQTDSIDAIAIATLALGLGSQLAGDFWVGRSHQTYRSSWHLIPLLYAGWAVVLGHHTFTATTGLYTLAAALVGMGVGRRTVRFNPLTLGALLLASIAAYQLLIYQLMQIAGGRLGDGLSLLAGLATVIAIGAQLGQRWLSSYLRLARSAVVGFAHGHWGLGSGLAAFALGFGLSDQGFLIWLGLAAALTFYALAHGRLSPANAAHCWTYHCWTYHCWTYLGILQAWVLIGKALYRALPATEMLIAWAAALAAIIAVCMYFLPWSSWGWPQQPWRRMAILLPGGLVALTPAKVTLQSLLIVAAFYAWIAKAERRPRLSYLSVLLFDWAALRFLLLQGWLALPWLSGLLAMTLLYVVQIDPGLRDASAREQRHWLRSLAVGLLSLTLFYQAEIEMDPTALPIRLLTLGFAIGLIFVGLVLQVRAFLYGGTATFVLQVLRLLWLFINREALLLWAIGIVTGLLLIWLAATFEARRHQVNALMQYWLTEFANWE